MKLSCVQATRDIHKGLLKQVPCTEGKSYQLKEVI